MQTPVVLAFSPPCVPASGPATPILDRRHRLGWSERLPARLGTAALWAGSIGLLGPLKLAGVLVTGSVLVPFLLQLDRGRRQSLPSPGSVQTPPLVLEAGLPRAVQAAELGLAEAQLFRARHASVCTVHHDAAGRIVDLEVPAPLAPVPVPSPDAHPVG
ncbi:MAG: hypothetical protein WCF98_11225 [Synechococcus sp. ELA057]